MSGLILLSPSYGFLGAYCNDGAFTFPSGLTVKLGSAYEQSGLRIANTSIIFLQYTLYDTHEIDFSLHLKSSPHTSYRHKISNAVQPWSMVNGILPGMQSLKHMESKDDTKTTIRRHLLNDDDFSASMWYDFRFTEMYTITLFGEYSEFYISAKIHSIKGNSNCGSLSIDMDGKRKYLKCGQSYQMTT